ncbi:DUF2975 domain-containing protein [Clostridium beijerinckii]|uniref:DUF2975 domain-containing protein n=1 Tax=Clostridium beijerinckii TaxID=1520 RepID=UPI00047A4CC1|nr:DUF2975 domain-containing protein [Clostridium beijerinckii]
MENNNKTISSIRTHCNKINYIVKLFLYIILFVTASSLIYTVIVLVLYGNSLEVNSFRDEFLIKPSNLHFFAGGNISKSLVTHFTDQPFTNIKLAFIIAEAMGLIKLSFAILIFYNIRKILNNIENKYTPFSVDNANKIKLVGILMIAYAIVPNLIAYPALNIIAEGVYLDLNNSIPIIFAASFILLLSKIFSYGCELQKDSDETL